MALGACLPARERGAVEVQLGVEVRSRTLLPTSLPVASYRLTFSSGGREIPVTTTATSVTVELAPGKWVLAVDGLDAGGVPVAGGGASDVLVEDGKTTPVSVVLGALATGSGAIDITVSWPPSQPVGAKTVALDGSAVSFTEPTASSVRCAGPRVAGSYVLEVSLDTGGAYPTVVCEVVRVYGNVTTAATIALADSDFVTPPAAPSALAAVAAGSAIGLSWTDNSRVETGYVLERSLASGDYGQAVTTALGANTTSWTDTGVSPGVRYYYRVKAVNSFGPSPWSGEAGASAASGAVQVTVTVVSPAGDAISFDKAGDVVVGVTETLVVSLLESFDSCRWILDGATVSTASNVSIDCGHVEPGAHHLAAIVMRAGAASSATLRFFVYN